MSIADSRKHQRELVLTGIGTFPREGTRDPRKGHITGSEVRGVTATRTAIRQFVNSYEEVLVVTGPPGSGKTALAKGILGELGADTSVIELDAQEGSSSSLIESVYSKLGLSDWTDDWQITLHRMGASLRPLEYAFLLIKSAHCLSHPEFEDLRLLALLRKPLGPALQIVLVGEDRLNEKLRDCELVRLELWRPLSCVLSSEDRFDHSPNNVTRLEVSKQVTQTPVASNQNHLKGSRNNLSTIAPQEGPSNGDPPETLDSITLLPTVVDSRNQAFRSIENERPQIQANTVAIPRHGAERSRLTARLKPVALATMAVMILAAGYLLSYDSGLEVDAAMEEEDSSGAGSQMSSETTTSSQFSSSDYIAFLLTETQPRLDYVSVPSTAKTASTTDHQASLTDDTAPSSVSPSDDSATPGARKLHPEVATPAVGVATNEAPEVSHADVIAELIQRGNEAVARNHLLTPPDVSAWKFFNQVLAIDPHNVAAETGKQKVIARYGVLADNALKRERYQLAGTLIERGLGIAPSDETLLSLSSALDLATRSPEPEDSISVESYENRESLQAKSNRVEESPNRLIGFFRKIFNGQGR